MDVAQLSFLSAHNLLLNKCVTHSLVETRPTRNRQPGFTRGNRDAAITGGISRPGSVLEETAAVR